MDENNQGAAGAQEQYNDGSLGAAVSAMPDFADTNLVDFATARDGSQAIIRPRDPASGQYTQAQPAQPPAVQDKAAAKQPVKAEAEEVDASSPAEEYFELPAAEEGGEPQRIPASEVFEGYQKARELQAELEEAKRIAPPPMEYDRQIYETVQARGQLLNELQAYSQMLQPQQPNVELINPASPNYDPQAYYQQVTVAQTLGQQLQNVKQRMASLQSEQTRETEALTRARFARERGKLQEVWPEVLSSPQRANQVRDMAQRLYGIDNETFAQTIDARFYAVLKDALAYRDGQKAKEAAVKVVRSKPKLVRASARTGEQSAKQQSIQTHYQRLTRSGSLDDAAEVLGGLLG